MGVEEGANDGWCSGRDTTLGHARVSLTQPAAWTKEESRWNAHRDNVTSLHLGIELRTVTDNGIDYRPSRPDNFPLSTAARENLVSPRELASFCQFFPINFS